MNLFWVIFGTASFTALMMSWVTALFIDRKNTKIKNYARKHKFCYACGAQFIFPVKEKQPKNKTIGFKSNE